MMYLQCMDENELENSIVMFSFKVPSKLRDSFHAAAKAENMDASNLLRQFMTRTIREAKEHDAEAFEEALLNEQKRSQKNKVQKTSRKAGAEISHKVNSHLAAVPPSAMPDYDYDGIYYELKERYNIDHLTIVSVMTGQDKILVSEEIREAILEVASRHLKNPDRKKVGNQ